MLPMVRARRVGRAEVAISISGSVDRNMAGCLGRVAEYMVLGADSPPERVELNLTEVTAVDEVGFTSLVDVAAGASAGGAAVVVRCGAARTMLARHRGGWLMASEQIGRMLRRRVMPVVRRRRLRRVPVDARSADGYPSAQVRRRPG